MIKTEAALPTMHHGPTSRYVMHCDSFPLHHGPHIPCTLTIPKQFIRVKLTIAHLPTVHYKPTNLYMVHYYIFLPHPLHSIYHNITNSLFLV